MGTVEQHFGVSLAWSTHGLLIAGFYISGLWECVFVFLCSLVCVFLPQPPILSRGSSRYDFGDEDAGVVAHMGVVCSSCYAEAKA